MTRLFEIRLPEGDIPGFDITSGRWENGARRYDPATWLSQGYDGVRFIGAGPGRTRIIPAPGIWKNITIDQHPGVTRLEGVSVHGRGLAAIYAGPIRRGRVKGFTLELEDFELIAEEPTAADPGRVAWGAFTYQCNLVIRNGVVWWGPAREHAFYQHGYADGRGGLFDGIDFRECAAECIKARFDPREIEWAGPLAALRVSDCRFFDWYRPHSSRGGAGITAQGLGGHLAIEGNEFWAPASSTRCVMVDDGLNTGAPRFYSATNGAPGTGFATGHVVIRRNLFVAGPGTENLSPVIRVGNLADGDHSVCQSLALEENAVYGRRLQVQLSDIPALRVRGNNSPAARAYAAMRGVDVSQEALVPTRDRAIPLSAYNVG